MTATLDKQIFLIEDDAVMAECIARALQSNQFQTWQVNLNIFPDALTAINVLSAKLPDLILLDILLNGPNGFTLLNELISYQDTAKIPSIVISSLNFALSDLEAYGVRAVLHKETMTPQDIQQTVQEILNHVD